MQLDITLSSTNSSFCSHKILNDSYWMFVFPLELLLKFPEKIRKHILKALIMKPLWLDIMSVPQNCNGANLQQM